MGKITVQEHVDFFAGLGVLGQQDVTLAAQVTFLLERADGGFAPFATFSRSNGKRVQYLIGGNFRRNIPPRYLVLVECTGNRVTLLHLMQFENCTAAQWKRVFDSLVDRIEKSLGI